MKVLIVSIVVIFLLLPVIFAQDSVSTFSSEKGFEWLNKQMNETNWTGTTQEVALSVLALRQGGYPVGQGVTILLDSRDVDNWGGDLIDTSYATFALYMTGHAIENETIWLKDQATKGNDDLGWLLQIRSAYNGSCILEYNEGIEKTVTLINNELTCDTTLKGSWISLSSCIGVLDSYEPLVVNCNNLAQASATLMYQTTNNNGFYLLEEKTGTKMPLPIQNNLYGSHDETGIVNWVLKEVGVSEEQYFSKHYLETTIDPKFDLPYGFAYQASGDSLYLNILQQPEHQKLSGSWSEDVFTTAYLYMVTKDSEAGTWLKNEQNADGSWNGDVFESAFSLFTLSTRLPPSVVKGCDNDGICETGEDSLSCSKDCVSPTGREDCANTLDDDGDLLKDCFDIDCKLAPNCLGGNVTRELCTNTIDDDGDLFSDCSDLDCKNDPSCVTTTGCTSDLDCETDERCQLGTCVSSTSPPDSGEESKEGSSFWPWFFLILIFIIAIVGAYFGYRKFKSGRKNQPNFEEFLRIQENDRNTPKNIPPKTTRSAPPQEGAYNSSERELDDAIRKARDLLGKK